MPDCEISPRPSHSVPSRKRGGADRTRGEGNRPKCDGQHVRAGTPALVSEHQQRAGHSRPALGASAMTSFSNIQSASPATAAPEAQSAHEEIDWEERRWQMEWDRRNIED